MLSHRAQPRGEEAVPSAPVTTSSCLSRRSAARAGQATTEWTLLLSVLVIAVVAAGYGLVSTFQSSMGGIGRGMGEVYTTGDLAR